MNKQWHVGIFLFDGMDILDFTGPYEVFSYAARDDRGWRNMLMGTATSADRPFITSTVSEKGNAVVANNGLKVQPDYSFQNAPRFDILLFPGAPLVPLQKALDNVNVLQWIRDRSREAEVTASVCSGAYFLAEAGLLTGKRATTHHAVIDHFQRNYPDVRVCKGVRAVDEGRFITSGGVTSGIHMALYIVSRFLGTDEARTLAAVIEFENNGRVLTPSGPLGPEAADPRDAGVTG